MYSSSKLLERRQQLGKIFPIYIQGRWIQESFVQITQAGSLLKKLAYIHFQRVYTAACIYKSAIFAERPSYQLHCSEHGSSHTTYQAMFFATTMPALPTA